MEKYLAFDVGGSYIKYGVVQGNGTVLSRGKSRTNSHLGSEHLLQQLCQIGERAMAREQFNGIAISTTGVVDAEQGVIQSEISSWIGGYNGTRLRQLLGQRTGLNVEIENDVNCMALGEHWLGAAKGFRNLVCMAIGTGIGGALLIDGELYRGSLNMAMEVGRMPVAHSHLEDLASVRALIYEYAKLSNIPTLDVDGLLVAQKVREGDRYAQEALEQMCYYLAHGVAVLTSTFTPDVLVLGGGITNDGDLLDSRLKRYLKEVLDNALWESLNLQYAKLGGDVGLVGAVRHYQLMTRQRKEEGDYGKAVC